MAVEITTGVNRSARARVWIAAILMVVSILALIINAIVAGVPALAGLLTSAFGLQKKNPYSAINRAIFAVCAVVAIFAVLISLLLVRTGNGPTTHTQISVR